MNVFLKNISFFGFLIFSTISSFAQDSTQIFYEKVKIVEQPKKNEWRFKLEPNVVMPRTTANLGAGEFNLPTIGNYKPEIHVNQSPNDFLNKLKIGSMISVEAYNDKWAINGDFSYFVLEQKVGNHAILKDARVHASQFFGDITVFRRLMPWLEVGIGANIINTGMSIEADIYDPYKPDSKIYELDIDKSKNWVDPMIAARISNKPDSRFLYMIRGDIGGFGVGSKLSWQTIGQVGYQLSRTIYGIVGYRYINIDYLKGHGLNRFKYDMHINGPMLKIGFNIP